MAGRTAARQARSFLKYRRGVHLYKNGRLVDVTRSRAVAVVTKRRSFVAVTWRLLPAGARTS